MKPKYPNVTCNSHDTVEPGYVICDHVKQAGDIAGFESATSKSAGTIYCQKCSRHLKNEKYVLNHFYVACAQCLRSQGLLRTIQ